MLGASDDQREDVGGCSSAWVLPRLRISGLGSRLRGRVAIAQDRVTDADEAEDTGLPTGAPMWKIILHLVWVAVRPWRWG